MTIPEYYKQFVDSSVDLNVTTSIPCNFHNEQHGKSFTYSKEKLMWRCWGSCHCGGDVVDLHRLNFGFKTREDAEKDLRRITGDNTLGKKFLREVDMENVTYRTAYNRAISICKTIDDYLALDYIMSQHPVSTQSLEEFIYERKNTYTESGTS